MTADVEVVTIGRWGVDIYPLPTGVGPEDVETFGKFLVGSPTNVAVAFASLGYSAAVLTGVGDDPFGRFVRREMVRLGVTDDFVFTRSDFTTAVTFWEMLPSDNMPLYLCRQPSAPDMQLIATDVPLDVIRRAKVLLVTVTGFSQEPTRSAHQAAIAARHMARHTVLARDYRPMFWSSHKEATEQVGKCLGRFTIAVGNREECEVASGEKDTDRAAGVLLGAGVEIAIVTQGPMGTLAKTRDERVVVPHPDRRRQRAGAGDTFGGRLPRPPQRLVARTHRAGRSLRRCWSVRRPCPAPMRSRPSSPAYPSPSSTEHFTELNNALHKE